MCFLSRHGMNADDSIALRDIECLEAFIMKSLTRIAFSFLLLAHSELIGFAQSGIITTYAGPGLPTNGLLASGQAIGAPSSIAADGAGGFYVAIGSQHLVCHITGDGRISVMAGNGTPGFRGDGGAAAVEAN